MLAAIYHPADEPSALLAPHRDSLVLKNAVHIALNIKSDPFTPAVKLNAMLYVMPLTQIRAVRSPNMVSVHPLPARKSSILIKS